MGMRDAMQRRLAGQLGDPRGVFGRLVARQLNKGNAALMADAVAALPPLERADLADLGFGGGAGLALLLARCGADGSVVGVDRSRTMVDAARRRFAAEPRVTVRAGSLLDLPLPDASLDGAITANTIYFVDDLGAMLRETVRVLRPGGRLVIAIGDPEDMAARPFTEHGFTLRPVDDVLGEAAGAGLVPAQHGRGGQAGQRYHLLGLDLPTTG